MKSMGFVRVWGTTSSSRQMYRGQPAGTLHAVGAELSRTPTMAQVSRLVNAARDAEHASVDVTDPMFGHRLGSFRTEYPDDPVGGKRMGPFIRQAVGTLEKHAMEEELLGRRRGGGYTRRSERPGRGSRGKALTEKELFGAYGLSHDAGMGEYDYRSPGKAMRPVPCPSCGLVNWSLMSGAPRQTCKGCGAPISMRAMAGAVAKGSVEQRLTRLQRSYTSNVRNAAKRLTPEVTAAGMAWYPGAEEWIAQQAARFGKPEVMVRGMAASLSAGTSWPGNKTKLIRILEADAQGKPFPYSTALNAHVKAQKMLAGADPWSLLGHTPKTGQFFLNTGGDLDALTIDRWAFRTATRGAISQYGKGPVRTGSDRAFRRVAKQMGMHPVELQAALWIQEKYDADVAAGRKPNIAKYMKKGGPVGGWTPEFTPEEAAADQEKIVENLRAGKSGSGGVPYWPVTKAEAEGRRPRTYEQDVTREGDIAELARLTKKSPEEIRKLTTATGAAPSQMAAGSAPPSNFETLAAAWFGQAKDWLAQPSEVRYGKQEGGPKHVPLPKDELTQAWLAEHAAGSRPAYVVAHGKHSDSALGALRKVRSWNADGTVTVNSWSPELFRPEALPINEVFPATASMINWVETEQKAYAGYGHNTRDRRRVIAEARYAIGAGPKPTARPKNKLGVDDKGRVIVVGPSGKELNVSGMDLSATELRHRDHNEDSIREFIQAQGDVDIIQAVHDRSTARQGYEPGVGRMYSKRLTPAEIQAYLDETVGQLTGQGEPKTTITPTIDRAYVADATAADRKRLTQDEIKAKNAEIIADIETKVAARDAAGLPGGSVPYPRAEPEGEPEFKRISREALEATKRRIAKEKMEAPAQAVSVAKKAATAGPSADELRAAIKDLGRSDPAMTKVLQDQLAKLEAERVPQHEAPEVTAHKAVMAHHEETKAVEAAVEREMGQQHGPMLSELIPGPRPSSLPTSDERFMERQAQAERRRRNDLIERARKSGLFTVSRRHRAAGGYIVNEAGPEAFIEASDVGKLAANRPDIFSRIPDGTHTGMINKPAWSSFRPQKDGLIVRREDAMGALAATRQAGGPADQDRPSRGPIYLPGGGASTPFYGPPRPPIAITQAGGGTRSPEMAAAAKELGAVPDVFKARMATAMDKLYAQIQEGIPSAAPAAAAEPPRPAWAPRTGTFDWAAARDRSARAEAARMAGGTSIPAWAMPAGTGGHADIHRMAAAEQDLDAETKKSIRAGKRATKEQQLREGRPAEGRAVLEAALQEAAGGRQLMAPAMSRRMVANITQSVFGGGKAFQEKQREFQSASADYNRALTDQQKATNNAKDAQNARNDWEAKGLGKNEELIRRQAVANKTLVDATEGRIKAEERLDKATKKVQPGVGDIVRSLGSVVVSTSVYGATLKAFSMAMEAAMPALEAGADEMLGFGATSQRVSKQIGASARDLGGNVPAAIAQAAGQGGLGSAGLAMAQQYLTTGVTAKGGGAAAQGGSDIYRAIAGAIGGAPEGLLGGYGGLGGGAVLGEMLGGGKGAAEIMTKDLSTITGLANRQVANPEFGKQINAQRETNRAAREARGVGPGVGLGTISDEETAAARALMGQSTGAGGGEGPAPAVSRFLPNPDQGKYLALRDTAIKDYNEAQNRYTKSIGKADSTTHLATAATVKDIAAKQSEAQTAANLAASMPGATDAMKQWADRVADLTKGGAVLVDAQGNAITTLEDFSKYFEQVAGGEMIPSMEAFAAGQARALKAQEQMAQVMLEHQLGVGIPGQMGMQLAAQPFIPAAAGVLTPKGQGYQGNIGGVNIGGVLRQAQQSQDQLTAAGATALENLSKWVGTQPGMGTAFSLPTGESFESGEAAFRSFTGEITASGKAIAGWQTKIAGIQMTQQWAQFSNNLRLANRAYADARALAGQGGGGRGSAGEMGGLERQQTLLGFSLTQKQINFQTALAGFQAAGPDIGRAGSSTGAGPGRGSYRPAAAEHPEADVRGRR